MSFFSIVRYLRRVEFIIACPELKQPLESYSFEMDYPENEDHNMTFNGTKITTLDNIKGHVIQLIRSLMQFSDTLSEVPSERIINMKVRSSFAPDRLIHDYPTNVMCGSTADCR